MGLDLSASGAELTAALTDIESVSGNEAAIAAEIDQALRALSWLHVERDGNVVVARTGLGRASRVVLAGHIDTVPVAGNVPSRLDGEGRLYGCGSTDMKSGVAVQLRMCQTVPEPAVDVTYVFYDCEEVDAERNGLGRLARTRPGLLAGDFAILLEPTSGDIEGGCQGTMRAAVTVEGKRAHTARSWMGLNAIHEAGEVLAVLRAYVPREPVVDGLKFHEGLNAVSISGGVAGNVVPDACEIAINYRFAPDRSGAQAEEHLREVFASWPVRVLDCAAGARPGLDDPLAAAFVAAVGGQARAKLGWTDVARFAELGVPAVNYGPGVPEIAHTAGEYVEVVKIAECERRLRSWLSERGQGPA